jgi:sugar phosphate isomerase/epimerase
MLLDEIGLKIHSGHCSTGFGKPEGYISMSHNWEKLCEDAAFVGQKFIACGYFEPDERKTIDDYKKHAESFNKCGLIARNYGLTFCHHNHDFEFIPIDGKVPYDILLSETDESLVKFELDHYWLEKANVNVSKLIKKNKSRFPLFHIKDMDKTSERSFTEVGSGIIDWKKIFKMKENAGMELFYVEQDTCKTMEPLESIKVSFDYLKKLSV